ncbi:M24 family metallopeptidase [Marispirochaeta aestuarii]|uniref:M24 family metallopeptidase n=1 Tax=Marispirochaeta aestuarii TaxID=1963862 RepID=UPI0029C7A4D2|nr:M24 family metallopeptidase [Marispirochaeta aestuarii]
MLSREGCLQRQNDLIRFLPEKCDLILITDPPYLLYFNNLWIEQNSTNQNSLNLFVFNENERIVFTDDSLFESASTSYAETIISSRWYGKKYPVFNRKEVVVREFSLWLDKFRPKKIAAELVSLPGIIQKAVEDRGILLTDISRELNQMRVRKYPDEIAEIRRIVGNASRTMDIVADSAKAGMSEWEIFGSLYKEFISIHKEQTSPVGDLVSDYRVSGFPRQRAVQTGDLLIIDFSPYVNGYRADIARTICVNSLPTNSQQEYSDILQESLRHTEKLLCPDIPGKVIYDSFLSFFRKNTIDKYYISHAGHGIGLKHPERPFFVLNCDETVPQGAVITLEPGLYNNDIGYMRIEDNYLITETGFEKLSFHRKTLKQTSY